ncbi:MAG: lytic transglycosylase domain-containing protein [Cetobacterium sp.]
MLNGIQSLNNNGISSFNKCQCNSNSDVFGILFISLLKAAQKQQINNNEVSSNLTVGNSINNLNSINNKEIENLTTDKRIENAISKASKKHGVDEKLIKSIIKVESNFNPNVVSSAGAKGLMQLMPENCKTYGVSDPFNIEQNVDAGTRHIKDYLNKYDQDVEMALMAYNGGPTRMARRGVKSINDIYKMPKETQNYVPKVMKYYRGL